MFRWVLWGSLAAYAVALVAALLAHPALPVEVAWHGANPLWTVWLPAITGIVLTRAIVTRRRRRKLDERTRNALEEHPIRAELCWLLLFLLCFVSGTVALPRLLGAAFPPDVYVTVVPALRVLFLLVLPILFVDRAGSTLSGNAPAMSALVMRVTESWRWLGALPVLVCIGLVGLGLRGEPFPPPGVFLFVMLLAFVAITVPEEVFFRGMVQTRLERAVGRWGGITVTSLLFALTYAAMDGYGEITALSAEGALHRLGCALLIYGVIGVLLGYVWSHYRNIWLSVLLRGGMLTLVIAPTVRIVG